VPAALGWTVLTLVFLDELLAVAALGVVGWGTSAAWLLVWLLPLAAVALWALFASPRARFGSAGRRPAATVVVFGAAVAGLWAVGHPGWAVALLVFSVAVNAAAELPGVRRLVSAHPR
jgi:hypothetical protein